MDNLLSRIGYCIICIMMQDKMIYVQETAKKPIFRKISFFTFYLHFIYMSSLHLVNLDAKILILKPFVRCILIEPGQGEKSSKVHT